MSDEMRFSEPIIEEKKEEIKPKVWQRVKIKKLHVLFAALLLVVLISAGTAVSFYLKAKKLKSQTGVATTSEIQKIMAEVGRLIVLPANEEPTVATISDAEKLRDQPFFTNAKNGDKVLIYGKAGKAILYDPTVKIIVEVAPLNMSNTK
ncbi:MAG: hypothetical protein V1896_02725 [Candidatus Zambryskibacteria bacterium]